MKLTDEKHDEKAIVITRQKTGSFWNNIYQKRHLTKYMKYINIFLTLKHYAMYTTEAFGYIK